MKSLTRLLINFISIISFAPFWPDVTEEDIGSNMGELKKYSWFQKHLENDKFKELIIYDRDVRNLIGEINGNKLKRNSYRNKCEKKIRNVLFRRASYLA